MATIPAVPPYSVDRPALRHRLDLALTQPCTLLIAPAGSGKSVLLAQWAASRPDLAFVWLQLEMADDDPVRFSQRLLQGLARVSSAAPDVDLAAAAFGGGLGSALIEGLERQMTEMPRSVVVLDDLHHLSNDRLIADLGQLSESFPEHVHLVVSTRIDLPLAWSRSRLLRNVTELRQVDLALDETESAELLERILGHALEPDEITALVKRTEGWVAGLQLAGMTLRTHPDSNSFIVQLSGDDRMIADYLSEQVLNAQPHRRRAVLLQSAVLDEMCAELVTCLTGESNAQLMLTELERESMFLVPLDDRREWFRFHHLFRDLLRFQLRVETPSAESDLLRQAANWHLDRGETNAAVEYSIRARDWDQVIEVILSRSSEVFEQTKMATVIRWIREIPEAIRFGRHNLNLQLGALLMADGQAVAAEDTLRHVASDPSASTGEQVCAQSLLAVLAQWRPRPDVSIAAAIRALDVLGKVGDSPIPRLLGLTDRQSLEALAVISGGRAYFLAGQLDLAREWLEDGLTSAGAGYSVWRIGALGSLALLEAWGGTVARADALASEALSVAREAGVLGHPVVADAFFAVAFAALERGEPRHAGLSIYEGLLRARINRREPLIWIGQLAKAMSQEAEGRFDEAMATLTPAENEIGSPPPPIAAQRIASLRARLLRLGGHPDQALSATTASRVPSSALLVEAVAAHLALGQPDRARKLIDQVPEDGSEPPLARTERQLMLAWLAASESREERSTALAEALEVAERYSLVEACVRAGPQVTRLISDDGPPSSFRDAVLQRARLVRGVPAENELLDPLTLRELQVLSYLPNRPTNTELAAQCFVSVNTIKSHIVHIYRKLGVTNRREAVIKARELGLLVEPSPR